jgi:hypothetical protein
MTASAAPSVLPVPTRNKLGIVALILVIVAIAAPIIAGIVGTVAAATAPAQNASSGGWAVLGGFVFILIGACILSPIAIVGVVLGAVSLSRHGQRKVQGIVAIVLGIVPALAVFGIPAALDALF